jgi:SAM-dependent methyltransferase
MLLKEQDSIILTVKKWNSEMYIEKQLKQIQDLYTKNIKEMGVTSKAVGWKTEECQSMRFAKLATVIAQDDRDISINDYGCGYGAMLTYFTEELRLPVSIYNGYDLSSDMLSAAALKLAEFKGQLKMVESSIIQTEADYSFVSGTFNVKFDASRESWEDFIREKLHEMDKLSAKGFAFNLLTLYVDYEESHLYYGDPCYWFDYCKRNFSKQVSLLHDYPLWEWTMIVRKYV